MTGVRGNPAIDGDDRAGHERRFPRHEECRDIRDFFGRSGAAQRNPFAPSRAIFWAGESYRMVGNNRQAFISYNNCRWKHPDSEGAKYARGRLALPEMLQQFEAEANSVDDNN